jgi:hypothetical protein
MVFETSGSRGSTANSSQKVHQQSQWLSPLRAREAVMPVRTAACAMLLSRRKAVRARGSTVSKRRAVDKQNQNE